MTLFGPLSNQKSSQNLSALFSKVKLEVNHVKQIYILCGVPKMDFRKNHPTKDQLPRNLSVSNKRKSWSSENGQVLTPNAFSKYNIISQGQTTRNNNQNYYSRIYFFSNNSPKGGKPSTVGSLLFGDAVLK